MYSVTPGPRLMGSAAGVSTNAAEGPVSEKVRLAIEDVVTNTSAVSVKDCVGLSPRLKSIRSGSTVSSGLLVSRFRVRLQRLLIWLTLT